MRPGMKKLKKKFIYLYMEKVQIISATAAATTTTLKQLKKKSQKCFIRK
jgi:hypothetical protein